MTKKEKIEEQIKKLLKEYFSLQTREFISKKTKIPLSAPSYGWEETYEVVKSLLTTSVTMGEKVHEFERIFANYIGVKNSVMVNSGSSANLLALSVLANPIIKHRIKRNDEIITPAVTWSTTIFPIVNVGAIPVLVDVDLKTYNIDADQIEKAITNRTRAIMLVHLLGNPCDMKRIMEIAEDHDLFVIEDACEAHGAEINGRRVGSFGDLSTFSFFFSHHISTIEGGMILTDKDEYAELARSLRAHGWIRELKNKEKIAKEYSEIDERYLFINVGFNVRPTEIQGGFGIHQIQKLDKFIEIRRENAKNLTKDLEEFREYLLLPTERENVKHVWFGYPITIKPTAPFHREELRDYLEAKLIETRPIMAGNMAEQPAIRLFKHRVVGDLKNSRTIMRRSFYFGNHHAMRQRERKYVTERIKEFMQVKVKQ